MPRVSLLGLGSSKAAGVQLKGLGATKVLIVTDKVLSKLGVADKIKTQLEATGVQAVIFDGVEPNPTDGNVEEGVKAYQANKCNGLVSLGGGSSHDCCKGIGVVVSHGGKVGDYALFKTPITKDLPPFVAINTTAGTGAEMTAAAVIVSDRVKWFLGDSRIMAHVAINDPALHAGMPRSVTAATGMDALTHAVEAYVSLSHNPMADALALGAIVLVTKYLRPAVANGQNMEARDKMCYAEFMAGAAFNSAHLGLVHGMAHQPGARFGLPHGICNAICLPIVCEYNLIACPERFANVAKAMGEDITGLTPMEAGAKAVAAIRKLSKDVGIPSGFAELGAKESDIPILTETAMKDVDIYSNPRTVNAKDVAELFKLALG